MGAAVTSEAAVVIAKVKPWTRPPWPRLLEIALGPPVVVMFVGYICVEAALGYRRESWFRRDVEDGERWFT